MVHFLRRLWHPGDRTLDPCSLGVGPSSHQFFSRQNKNSKRHIFFGWSCSSFTTFGSLLSQNETQLSLGILVEGQFAPFEVWPVSAHYRNFAPCRGAPLWVQPPSVHESTDFTQASEEGGFVQLFQALAHWETHGVLCFPPFYDALVQSLSWFRWYGWALGSIGGVWGEGSFPSRSASIPSHSVFFFESSGQWWMFRISFSRKV